MLWRECALLSSNTKSNFEAMSETKLLILTSWECLSLKKKYMTVVNYLLLKA